jgi:hypothetical protein
MAAILNRFDYTVVLPWLGFATFNGLDPAGILYGLLVYHNGGTRDV